MLCPLFGLAVVHHNASGNGYVEAEPAVELHYVLALVENVVRDGAILRAEQVDGPFWVAECLQIGGPVSQLHTNKRTRERPVIQEVISGLVVEERNMPECFHGVGMLPLVSSANGEHEVGPEAEGRPPQGADIGWCFDIVDADSEVATVGQ